VFHACGDTRWWDAIEGEQYDTNVKGTMLAVRVARATHSVRRFIYTSTVDVMGSIGGGILAEGETGIPFDYHYAVTKSTAERHVLSIASMATTRHDLRFIVIRPGSMIGPWDVTNQYGRLFAEIKHGRLLGVPCGGTSVCHVADVAAAHVNAAFAQQLEHTVYVCAGVNMTYRELFRHMRSALQTFGPVANPSPIETRIGVCCLPCEVLPEKVLVAYGWCCELYANLVSGTKPGVNPGMARYLSKHAYYSSDRAERELGYPAQTAERWAAALVESLRWYVRRGRV
jgi:nucleoside-diphosphate-sugar epimerase